MISLKKYGRKWHIYGDETLLSPWAENVENIQGSLIKKNSNRKVWLVTAEDGNCYYIKRERKFHLPFTVSKAEKEYRAYALLGEKGIPCADCCAWSTTFDDSILATRALPQTFCSLLKYWYTKPEVDLNFLQKLCNFLAFVVKAGIYHPDFHSENLLSNGEYIVMIDPVGVTEAEPTSSPSIRMLVPLTVMFGDIPMEEIAKTLHGSGLFDSQEETLKQLTLLQAQQRELIEQEWSKRERQILSGTSKFATEVEPGKFFRNSAWFAPLLRYPEKILEEKVLPESEANDLWLRSFRCQLLKEKCDEVPIIYEKTGANVKISLLKDKKYSFFYGFR